MIYVCLCLSIFLFSPYFYKNIIPWLFHIFHATFAAYDQIDTIYYIWTLDKMNLFNSIVSNPWTLGKWFLMVWD